MSSKQGVLKDVLPPLTPLQRAAETYLLALNEKSNATTRAKKREEEMVALAQKLGEDFCKVRDEDGFMHTFSFEVKSAIRHSKLLDVKIVKHDDDKTDGKKVAAGDKD